MDTENEHTTVDAGDDTDTLLAALNALREQSDRYDRAVRFAQLIPQLPDELLDDALSIARSVEEDSERARLLQILAERMREPVLDEALTSAREIDSEVGSAWALVNLLPLLDDSAVRELVEFARTYSNPYARSILISRLAPKLGDSEQEALVAEALDETRRMNDDMERLYALQMLSPLLPDHLTDTALETARAITSDFYRQRAVEALVPRLSSERIAQLEAEELARPAHAAPRDVSTRRRQWTDDVEVDLSGGPFANILLMDFDGARLATDVCEVLCALDSSYSGLWMLRMLTSSQGSSSDARAAALQLERTLADAAPNELGRFVPTRDKLYLLAARFGSPGWLAIVGALNPLETIRQFLCDRHERKKDRGYRNAAERRRLSLELDTIALENVEKALALQLEAGTAQLVVQLLRARLVDEPLRGIAMWQDRGALAGARWVTEETVRSELEAPLE